MSEPTPSLDDALLIEAACARFEAEHRAGRSPSVEEHLAVVDARLRPFLEPELTALARELEFSLAPVVASDLPSRLGRYRIVAKLGEGGMGLVYEAEQDAPRRRVAVKVVRSDIASPEATRRFQREVKVLGHLHHPGIAQIFEAGVEPAAGTRAPIPYLVMELVRGKPLLDFAAANRLGVRERLELVRRICFAVQHAHDQGVVHRDLKPANILVVDEVSTSSRGGTGLTEVGQPKVLDFGVASASGRDAALTLETGVGQILGTLSHMSPEQLAGDSTAIDLRCDIYALGVILYELLGGRLPYDLAGLTVPAAIEKVRSHDPTRLGDLDDRLRGDVEVIVAKALEKEPARRYASALDLAVDLQRHLDDEPIRARPPDAVDRLRKFARRNRSLFTGLATAGSALVVALVVVSILAVRQSRLRADAESARDQASREAKKAIAISDFLEDTLEKANVDAGGNPRETTLLSVLDGAAAEIDGALPDEPLVEASLRLTIGKSYSAISELDQAIVHLRRALALRRGSLGSEDLDVAEAENRLAQALERKGEYAEAEELLRHALGVQRAKGEADHDGVAVLLNNLASVLGRRGVLDEAETAYREALAMRERFDGPDSLATASSRNNLASNLELRGKLDEAEGLYRGALATRRSKLVAPNAKLANSINNLGGFLVGRRKLEEAEKLFREALVMREQLLPAGHPDIDQVLCNLGVVYAQRGDLDAAVEVLRRALDSSRARLGSDHLNVQTVAVNLASTLHKAGRHDDARPLLVQAVDRFRETSGEDHPSTLWAEYWLARVEADRGDLNESERLLREVVEARRRVLGDSVKTVECLWQLADVLARSGRPEGGVEFVREALERAVRASGPEHPIALEASARLARQLMVAGATDQARSIAADVFSRAAALDHVGGSLATVIDDLKAGFARPRE